MKKMDTVDVSDGAGSQKDSYTATRNLITSILDDTGVGITSKMEEICDELGLPQQRGYAFQGDESKFIVFDPNMEGWERYLTIFHELGHQLFGHLRVKVSKEQMQHNEEEARTFSAVMTALCLFQQYGEYIGGKSK